MRYIAGLLFSLFLTLMVSEISFADQLAGRSACNSLLFNSRVMQAIPIQGIEGENKWREAYLNLLHIVFEGIDEIAADAFGHAIHAQAKVQLLNILVSSDSPINPLNVLKSHNTNEPESSRNDSMRLTTSQLSHFSPKLSTLSESGQLEIISGNLTDKDWSHIRTTAQQMLAQMQKVRTAQVLAEPATEKDYEDSPDLNGDNRLHRFIRQGHFAEAIQLLKDRSLSDDYLNQINLKGETPLDLVPFTRLEDYAVIDPSADKGAIDRLTEQLLVRKAERRKSTFRLEVVLLGAAVQNDLSTIQRVYDLGLNFSKEDTRPKTSTPLLLATRSGNVEAIRLLIKLGANVNHLGTVGKPPLLEAISTRQPLAIVEALLEGKPELDNLYPVYSKNFEHLSNTSVIFNAVSTGQVEVVELLLKHGAKPDLRTKGGMTIWHWLAFLSVPEKSLRMLEILKSLPIQHLINSRSSELADTTPFAITLFKETPPEITDFFLAKLPKGTQP